MKSFALGIVTVGLLACGTATTPKVVADPDAKLPDLRIKKIEYRQQHRQQITRRSVYEPNVALLAYELTILIENVGNKAVNEPFYVSYSGSLTEYQDHLFSRHFRLNNERHTIQPGTALPFIVPIVLDFPPPFSKIQHYPLRVYINTEGSANSTGFPTVYIAERSYDNNKYELQLKLR
jgi:hypothetical protein